MTYLYQAIRAWLADWFLDRWIPSKSRAASKWQLIKAEALATWQKLGTRNTADR